MLLLGPLDPLAASDYTANRRQPSIITIQVIGQRQGALYLVYCIDVVIMPAYRGVDNEDLLDWRDEQRGP